MDNYQTETIDIDFELINDSEIHPSEVMSDHRTIADPEEISAEFVRSCIETPEGRSHEA